MFTYMTTERPRGYISPANPGFGTPPARAFAANWRLAVPPEEQDVMIREHHAGHVRGTYAARPRGICLHGSRSGRDWTLAQEYYATVNYASQPTTEVGWNVTIGEDRWCDHMTVEQWGWHAGAANSRYLGVEFAQATVDAPVTDGQVRAFVDWYRLRVVPRWGEYRVLPLTFATHAELEAWGITERPDGKTDVFPFEDARAEELRARINAALAAPGEEDTMRIAELEQLLAERNSLLGVIRTEYADALETAITDVEHNARKYTRVQKACQYGLRPVLNTLRGVGT